MQKKLLMLLLGVALPAIVVAAENEFERIRAELAHAFPDLANATVRESPLPGLFEVELDGQIAYISRDARFLVVGDLIDIKSRANLSEQARARTAVRLIEEVGEANMIVMGPDKPKRTLTVFTDVDCPYCARLHLDVPELTRNGVRVRYLLFPRAGVGSETYKKSVAVWCASDRVKAVGIAKAGGKIDMKTCPNPVDRHYALGQRLGVSGTPTIYLDNGHKIGGYVPADKMLALLGIKAEARPTAAR